MKNRQIMMDTEARSKAMNVHKSYFDRARDAIDNGYYLEAVMYDYAAIEGRLEVICGLLGCPCNKNLTPKVRSKIKISHRIKCLKALYKKHPACVNSTSKLSGDFWERLSKWTKNRNIFVHGLYKRPELYEQRLTERKQLADEGLEFARLLYNEAKRIRRIENKYPEMIVYDGQRCKGKICFDTEVAK